MYNTIARADLLRVSLVNADPLSILIVEDIDEVARSTAELLSLHGHSVRTAGSGPDALRLIDAAAPDVILLDIGLPGMTGWEVAAAVRRRGGRQPVVVALTGLGADADRWKSADAGIDLHLVKPADPTALAALLARVREHLAAAR